MNLFWTVLILVPVGLLLMVSGLFIIVIIVMGIVGGVDGIATAMRHRRRAATTMAGRKRTRTRGTPIGGPALHH